MESYYGSFDDPSFHDMKRYAWNNNAPVSRPEQLVCKKCNHELNQPVQNCVRCGTERAMYDVEGNNNSSAEHFNGGSAKMAHFSTHCCCTIIALALFFARSRNNSFKSRDVWAIILILFAPYVYIIYVLFAVLGGLGCEFK